MYRLGDNAQKSYVVHRRLTNEKSAAIIRNLLATGGTNSYTIEKNGVHKMIFQSAWKENGFVAGLCEISMIIPAELPHHIRG
jgi:hypothetical protein